jgi:prepilin-type N-terminal cleavage/methylation domain-containing protein
MKIKAFTLVEILVTVLVVAILSSMGLVLWDNSVDTARQRICAQNQYILQESLKMYIYDRDTVPVSLSAIAPEYTDLALAKLNRENPLLKPIRAINLALIRINDGKKAWAEGKLSDYIRGDSNILRCPAKQGSGLSYGYNETLNTGDALTKFRELENNGLPIICDSDNATFSASGGNITGAAFRHGRNFIAQREIALSSGGRGVVQITPSNKNYTTGPIPAHANAAARARERTGSQ